MTILKIDSSITGEHSVSRKLTAAALAQLSGRRSDATVVARDLVAQPLDHVTLAAFADTDVLDEFLAADTVIVGAPMYNFGIPSQLKAWIDRITSPAPPSATPPRAVPRASSATRSVTVAISRGGFTRRAARWSMSKPTSRGVFGFIGIVPEFVHADGIAVGPEQREAGIANGLAEVERLAA